MFERALVTFVVDEEETLIFSEPSLMRVRSAVPGA